MSEGRHFGAASGACKPELAFRHIRCVTVERQSLAERDFAKATVTPDAIECPEFV
jgi:hypothetical protein